MEIHTVYRSILEYTVSHAPYCMYSVTRHSINTSDTLESEASFRREEWIAPPEPCNTGRLPKQQNV